MSLECRGEYCPHRSRWLHRPRTPNDAPKAERPSTDLQIRVLERRPTEAVNVSATAGSRQGDPLLWWVCDGDRIVDPSLIGVEHLAKLSANASGSPA